MLDKQELTEQLEVAKLEQGLAESNLAKIKAIKDAKAYTSGKASNIARTTANQANTPNKPAQQKSKEQIQAEAAKALAQAQKDTVQAYIDAFKSSDITAPTGKTTVTGDFIETRILAR